MAVEFAAQARAKQNLTSDSQRPGRMILNVGDDDWPFPIPIVKQAGKWYFDSNAGRNEILLRRIGRNELDAIEICRGYVEAQYEYAICAANISTPGTQMVLHGKTLMAPAMVLSARM
jgi:hypothetical protein